VLGIVIGAPLLALVDNYFFVSPTGTFSAPTPSELFACGVALYVYITTFEICAISAPALVVPAAPPVPQFGDMELLEDASEIELLETAGQILADNTDDPLIREKIDTLLAGKSVNH